jgi:hypothetical protein
VGPLKQVSLKDCVARVAFVNRTDAEKAVQEYNNVALDGASVVGQAFFRSPAHPNRWGCWT